MMERLRFNDTGGWLIVAAFVLFWFVAIGGWVANVAKIFWTAGDPLTAFFLIRCIGVVVPPVGVVLGYL